MKKFVFGNVLILAPSYEEAMTQYASYCVRVGNHSVRHGAVIEKRPDHRYRFCGTVVTEMFLYTKYKQHRLSNQITFVHFVRDLIVSGKIERID